MKATVVTVVVLCLKIIATLLIQASKSVPPAGVARRWTMLGYGNAFERGQRRCRRDLCWRCIERLGECTDWSDCCISQSEYGSSAVAHIVFILAFATLRVLHTILYALKLTKSCCIAFFIGIHCVLLFMAINALIGAINT